jgi:hypothetical protein
VTGLEGEDQIEREADEAIAVTIPKRCGQLAEDRLYVAALHVRIMEDRIAQEQA